MKKLLSKINEWLDLNDEFTAKTINKWVIAILLLAGLSAWLLIPEKVDNFGAEQKPWKKDESLKLKCKKEKVKSYWITKDYTKKITNPKLGATGETASTTEDYFELVELPTAPTSTVEYTYVSDIVAPPEENEVIELREENIQHFDIGNNQLIAKVYDKNAPLFAKIEDVWFKIETATTTLEAFDDQTKETVSLVDAFVGKASADTATTSPSKDTFVDQAAANTNYYTTDYSYIGNPGGTRRQNQFFQYTTPNISGTISSTYINVVNIWNGESSVIAVVYYAGRPTEQVYNQLTYNIYKTGSNWTTPGGDVSTAISTTTLATSVANRVNKLYTGVLNFNTTYDFIVKAANNNYQTFGLSENTNVALRPFIEIIYTASEAPTSTSIISPIINFE